MRFIILLVSLSVFIVSCSTEKNIVSKKIQVTLIDENTNAYIESGEVTLISIIGNIDVNNDVKYTDAVGNCSFLFDYGQGNQYRIHARKEGLLNYLVNDSLDNRKSYVEINENTEEDLTLYLTSDSMNHINYWKEVTPYYEMGELISLLKSNSYKEGLPQLLWEDIPALLFAGNDSALITHFPRNMVSSYYMDDCFVGIITLWFIESIRISERDNLISPFERFPSLNPILKFKSPPETFPENSIDKLNQAFEAYQLWWESVQQLPKEEAYKIDPFETVNLSWN